MAEAIDELRKYHKGWADAMGVFWRERMEKLRTIDTGALYSSIKARIEEGSVTTIEHNFLQYGIYVAAGVGPAHEWFKWTKAQGGGKPKGRRDWFSQKYYSSVMRLNEREADFYGETYNGLMATALDEIFSGVGAARNL